MAQCARIGACSDYELDPNNCQACVLGGPYYLCRSCEGEFEEQDGIDCPMCKLWFCDNCYDTDLGDGCQCHGDIDKDKRTFYKTVIEVVVLSEEPFQWNDLKDVHYEINEGHCVGTVREVESKTTSARKMRGLLYKAGSEPGFFELPEEIDTLTPTHAPKCDKCGERMFDDENGEWDCKCKFGTKEMK